LLDAEMNSPRVEKIRQDIYKLDPDARITDLHLWRVGRNQYACVLGLETNLAQTEQVKNQLQSHEGLAHISIEFIAAKNTGTEL
jgi:Co/Zn/Cd efflux system component